MTTRLSDAQIQQFIEQGYIKLEQAFPRELADEGRRILWQATGCNPHDPSTWTQPVIRLGYFAQEPFRKAANTPALLAAFDQLAGKGRWRPCYAIGTFPVRFPSPGDPGDTGWHVDASFGDDINDFFSWRVNVQSKGRALLMLFLFSDITEQEAPTRLRAGSHLDVARLLLPAGEAGLTFRELSDQLDATAHRPEVLATGAAGTVYLCHPFIAHAAQPHRGKTPRFLAQPPLVIDGGYDIFNDGAEHCPVALAIRKGLTEN